MTLLAPQPPKDKKDSAEGIEQAPFLSYIVRHDGLSSVLPSTVTSRVSYGRYDAVELVHRCTSCMTAPSFDSFADARLIY